MTSCEIFMSMKITKHWLKVLWKQHVLSHKRGAMGEVDVTFILQVDRFGSLFVS